MCEKERVCVCVKKRGESDVANKNTEVCDSEKVIECKRETGRERGEMKGGNDEKCQTEVESCYRD